MNRRRVLQQVAVGGALLTAGCTTLLEEPRPLNFAVVNRRQRSYHLEFIVWDDDGEVLDGVVDIAPRPPGDGEYTVLQFPDLTRVRNGDVIEIRVRVAGETFEESYEVTCNESERAENDVFFRIRHPDAPTANDSGMEFSGST